MKKTMNYKKGGVFTMKKIRFFIISFSLTLLLICGCATTSVKKQSKVEELKPCRVDSCFIETLYQGKESVTKAAVFTISNPNDFMVIIESFEFFIKIENHGIDGRSFDNELFLPAGRKLEISVPFQITWVGLALNLLDQNRTGLNKGVVQILPLWKGLNGKLFNPKLKKLWIKTEAIKPEYSLTGSLVTVDLEGNKADSVYSLTLPE